MTSLPNESNFRSATLQLIPAQKGKATLLRKGQYARIINTHGGQVVDTWAVAVENNNNNTADTTTAEYMSMSHARAHLDKIMPAVNDTLVTNHRRPILTLVEDTTSEKTHDTLIAACDIYRYQQLGCTESYHDNCADNFHAALKEIGLTSNLSFTPDPLNCFMDIPINNNQSGKGSCYPISWNPSTCEKGQYVTFRAEMDLVLVMSACPQDMVPINGVDCRPRECHFVVV
ncbi:hypothetical protein VTN77DRAFT_3348 [Rasamsonia byssochlamydoides]|uniref:uncharacterized protein n=1 Tax=Rasamsonia byssochlamydoides TaxID=89139 RepID=UPI0037421F86